MQMKTMHLFSIMISLFFSLHLIASKNLQKRQIPTNLIANSSGLPDGIETDENDPCPNTYLPPGKKFKTVNVVNSLTEEIKTFCGCNRNQRLDSYPKDPDDMNSRICVDCENGWYVDDDVHYVWKCKKRDDDTQTDQYQTSKVSILHSTIPTTLTASTEHENSKIQSFPTKISSSAAGVQLPHFNLSAFAWAICGAVFSIIITAGLGICLWIKCFCCKTEQNEVNVGDKQKRNPSECSPSFVRVENDNRSDYGGTARNSLLKNQSKRKKTWCISWSHYKKKRFSAPLRLSLPEGKDSVENEKAIDVTDPLLPFGESLPNSQTSNQDLQTISSSNSFDHHEPSSTTSTDNQFQTQRVAVNATNAVLESNSINPAFTCEDVNSLSSNHYSNSASSKAPCTSRLPTSSISCQTDFTSSQENKIKCIIEYLKNSDNEINYDDSFNLASMHSVHLPSHPSLIAIDRFVELISKGFDEGKITARNVINYFKTNGMSRPHLEMLGFLENEGFLDIDAA